MRDEFRSFKVSGAAIEGGSAIGALSTRSESVDQMVIERLGSKEIVGDLDDLFVAF